MPCCKAGDYKWCEDLPVVDYKDEEGNEYCVFHAPKGKKNITIQEFNKLVFDKIEKAKKDNAKCDLSATIFEGPIKFSQFNEDNPLPAINFNGAKFEEVADFIGTSFGGLTDFSWAHLGPVNFYKAKFDLMVVFFFTQFSSGAEFRWAKFNDVAVFSLTRFYSETQFLGETFKGAFFLQCYIEGKFRFEKVNLKNVCFTDTDIRRIDFINCDWPKRFGRNVVSDELTILSKRSVYDNLLFKEFLHKITQGYHHVKDTKFAENDSKELNKDIPSREENIKKVETIYRLLKQKYKEEHNEAEVSNWHYGEKEMFRKSCFFRRYFPFSFSNLYWLSSGYGERPLRAGIVLLLLIATISFFFGLVGIEQANQSISSRVIEIQTWSDVINWDYLKNLFLNTLQYAIFDKSPDFVPKTISGKFLKILTQMLIPIQTALFALALRNRFRR